VEQIALDEQGATILLSMAELDLVNRAMREITNGVHIPDWEFKTRLGETPADARQLLAEVSDTYRELSAGSE
jgi:hypothetical protein